MVSAEAVTSKPADCRSLVSRAAHPLSATAQASAIPAVLIMIALQAGSGRFSWRRRTLQNRQCALFLLMYEASQQAASPYCRNKIVFHNFASFPTQHPEFGQDRAKLCVASGTCLPMHAHQTQPSSSVPAVRPCTGPRQHGASIHSQRKPAAIFPATTAAQRHEGPRRRAQP